MVSNNKMFTGISSQELKLVCKTHKVNSWLGESDEEHNDDTKRRSNDKILKKNKPPPYKLSKSVNQIKQEQLIAAVAENNNHNVPYASICRGYEHVVKAVSNCKAGVSAGASAKAKQGSHTLLSPEAKKVPKTRECMTTRSGSLHELQHSTPRQSPAVPPVLLPHHFLDIQGKQNNTETDPKEVATISLKKKKSKSKVCRTTTQINQNDNTHLYSNPATPFQVPFPNHLLLPNTVQGPTKSCTSEYVWPKEYIKNIKSFNTMQTQSEQDMKKWAFIKKTTKKPKIKAKKQPDNKQNLFVDSNSFSLLAPCTDDEKSESNDESLECDFNGEIKQPHETSAQENGTKKKKHKKKGELKVKTIEKDLKHIKLYETKDRFVLRDKNCNKLADIHHEAQIPLPDYFVKRHLRIVHPQRGCERYMPQCIEIQELMVRNDVLHKISEMTRHSRITSGYILRGTVFQPLYLQAQALRPRSNGEIIRALMTAHVLRHK